MYAGNTANSLIAVSSLSVTVTVILTDSGLLNWSFIDGGGTRLLIVYDSLSKEMVIAIK